MAPRGRSARQIVDNVRTHSKPSELRITDLRVAVDENHGEGMAPIVRIDTNQGISGYGQGRNGSSKTYALMLKGRLLGENPCDVDKLFRKIKQFGGHGRQGGGVSAVEIALWDLAGKAYGVPVYQLLGGEFRDRIRCYCDTPWVADPKEMGRRLKARMSQGFTFLKMDLGIQQLKGIPGTVIAPSGILEIKGVQQPFRFVHLTDKGIDLMCQYVEGVREVIGYDIPLAVDHFGPIALESGIRLARALDKYRLAWLEDMFPWQFWEMYQKLSQSCETPICTGENIYLKEGFYDLFKNRAISLAHPDLLCSGGIMETKKIGDLAQEYGISMVIHHHPSPIGAMASVHCAAATENFMALEIHAVDVDYWNDMVTGVEKPIIQNGWIPVPQGPGLGIELNDEVVKAHI
ncbi:MAG: mandelate racemase/muconate lactonizing enzyme family protein, partial [Chloroflexota bacterium]|nr:mandelate racemase/muconate lactonizing enzyme family protein [Chloroflexota bacterium]